MQSPESVNSHTTHIDRIKAITCDRVYNTHSFSRWSTSSTDDCLISVIPINPADNEEWKSIQSIHDWRLALQYIKLICVVAASKEWEYLGRSTEWKGSRKSWVSHCSCPFTVFSLSQFKALLFTDRIMSLFRALYSLSRKKNPGFSNSSSRMSLMRGGGIIDWAYKNKSSIQQRVYQFVHGIY